MSSPDEPPPDGVCEERLVPMALLAMGTRVRRWIATGAMLAELKADSPAKPPER
jgi:hypothetical protein